MGVYARSHIETFQQGVDVALHGKSEPPFIAGAPNSFSSKSFRRRDLKAAVAAGSVAAVIIHVVTDEVTRDDIPGGRPLQLDVNGWVGRRGHVAARLGCHDGVQGVVPDESRLRQAIQGLAQAKDAVRMRGVDEALRLSHVDGRRGRQRSVQVRIHKISLLN